MAVILFGKNLLESNLSMSSIIIGSFAALGYLMSHVVNTEKLTVLFPISIMASSIVTFTLSGHYHLRQIMIFANLIIQSFRLLVHLSRRISNDKEDKRFNRIRNSSAANFLFFMLFAVFGFAYTLPLTVSGSIRSNMQPKFKTSDVMGMIMWGVGFLMETVADMQLFHHNHKVEKYGNVHVGGLWKFMRHPNYIGNILECWGNFILCSPSLVGMEWMTILSPLFLTFMLLFVTGIPPVERAMKNKMWLSNGYNKYSTTTGKYLPFMSMLRRAVGALSNRRAAKKAGKAMDKVREDSVNETEGLVEMARKGREEFERRRQEDRTFPVQGSILLNSPGTLNRKGGLEAYGQRAAGKAAQASEATRKETTIGSGI